MKSFTVSFFPSKRMIPNHSLPHTSAENLGMRTDKQSEFSLLAEIVNEARCLKRESSLECLDYRLHDSTQN